jgi:lipoprotein-anchoring transpeptidase ErfK/SrfK
MTPVAPPALADPTGLRRRRRLLRVVAVAVAVAATGCGSQTAEPTINTASTLAPVTEVSLAPGTSLVAQPRVDGELQFRAAPDLTAEVVATLTNPRTLDTDPPVDIPLVMLVADRTEAWVQVYLPIRPNGSTGWIPASAVDISQHPWRIEAVLDDFSLTVYRNDEPVWQTDIGVARDNAPTPGGLYYTTELVKPPDDTSVYGAYAYGLSGFSEVFESFNGGPGQLGIHGTNEPELIGQRVSAGCIRLRNDDITYMVEQLKLPLGVPVTIVTGAS